MEFWEMIRKALTQMKNDRDPKDWSKTEIIEFIELTETEILNICKDDPPKQKLCKILFVNGNPKLEQAAKKITELDHWNFIDENTFRRIFKHGRGGKHTRIKNAFAIYLGYDSATDLEENYLNRNNELKPSKTAFPVIIEQADLDLSDLAYLIRLCYTLNPQPYRKAMALETRLSYNNGLKLHYRTILDNIRLPFIHTPWSTAIYDAHKLRIEKAGQATQLAQFYRHLKDGRHRLEQIETVLAKSLEHPIDNTELFKKLEYNRNLKIIEAKIEWAKAAIILAQLWPRDLAFSQLPHLLKVTGFKLSKIELKSIRIELTQQVAKLYKDKGKLIQDTFNLPSPQNSSLVKTVDNEEDLEKLLEESKKMLDEFITPGKSKFGEEFEQNIIDSAEREVDPVIHLPYLRYVRALGGASQPGQLPRSHWLQLLQKKLITEERSLEQFLYLIQDAFYESDEAAIVFYLRRALELENLPSIYRHYLQLSLKRMEEPDFLGESIGIMVIRVLSSGALEQAGIQAGDVIYKINDKEVMNPELIFQLLPGIDGSKTHKFEFYRGGQFLTVNAVSNLPLGVDLSPLITWFLIRQ